MRSVRMAVTVTAERRDLPLLDRRRSFGGTGVRRQHPGSQEKLIELNTSSADSMALHLAPDLTDVVRGSGVEVQTTTTATLSAHLPTPTSRFGACSTAEHPSRLGLTLVEVDPASFGLAV